MKKLFTLLLLIPLLATAQDFDVWQNLAQKQTGYIVSIDQKSKNLRKFGYNADIDTGVEEQVWLTGDAETLSTTNDITHFASTDNGDGQPEPQGCDDHIEERCLVPDLLDIRNIKERNRGGRLQDTDKGKGRGFQDTGDHTRTLLSGSSNTFVGLTAYLSGVNHIAIVYERT